MCECFLVVESLDDLGDVDEKVEVRKADRMLRGERISEVSLVLSVAHKNRQS